MRKLMTIMAVLFCFVASAQYTPTGSKTRFVNGIGLGTKSDAAFGTVDSLVLYASADSTLKFKYKGTARALAYASTLTGYVPYTGATSDVDLGAFKLNAQSIGIKGTGGNGHLALKHQSSATTASANESNLYANSSGDLAWLNDHTYLTTFVTSANTANRTYTFPDFAGNVILDAGTQTITGAKTFSSNLTALGSIAVRASAAKVYQLSLLQASDSTSGWAFEADNSGNLTLIRRSSGVYQSPTFSWSSAGTITTNGNSITIGSTIGSGTGTMFTKNNFFTALNYGTSGTPVYEEILGYSYNAFSKFALETSNSYNSNQSTGIRFKITNGSGTAIYPLTFSNGVGDANFSSLGTGTVYSNSGTLTNTNPSDSSLKNTIKPLGYGLSEVLRLQPKTFYYNSDSAKNSLKYGFIAQEVQKIMPDVVRSFNVTKTIDSSGVKVQKVIQKLGLESDGIYVTLVKAIQEQQVIIDDLKKRIIALENK